jgi:hypothetical protein
MKALSTLKSAIDKSSLGIIALVLLTPVIFPRLAHAADAQTLGQQAQIFEIKITDAKLLNQTPNQNTDAQNSLSIATVTQSDPLTVNLHDYLEQHNSPLADYTTQLLSHDNWKMVIAISFVESNMCQHNLHYNCSGIGGPGHFYAFKDFGGWIDCMSTLLTNRYGGWSLDKMNGVYVQPRSVNWGLGSKRILAQLTDLEQQSESQRRDLAQQHTDSVTALVTFADPAN